MDNKSKIAFDLWNSSNKEELGKTDYAYISRHHPNDNIKKQALLLSESKETKRNKKKYQYTKEQREKRIAQAKQYYDNHYKGVLGYKKKEKEKIKESVLHWCKINSDKTFEELSNIYNSIDEKTLRLWLKDNNIKLDNTPINRKLLKTPERFPQKYNN